MPQTPPTLVRRLHNGGETLAQTLVLLFLPRECSQFGSLTQTSRWVQYFQSVGPVHAEEESEMGARFREQLRKWDLILPATLLYEPK